MTKALNINNLLVNTLSRLQNMKPGENMILGTWTAASPRWFTTVGSLYFFICGHAGVKQKTCEYVLILPANLLFPGKYHLDEMFPFKRLSIWVFQRPPPQGCRELVSSHYSSNSNVKTFMCVQYVWTDSALLAVQSGTVMNHCNLQSLQRRRYHRLLKTAALHWLP